MCTPAAALVALLLCQPPTIDPKLGPLANAPDEQPQALEREIPLDDLISCLPRAEVERTFDASTYKWTTDPRTEEMLRRIDAGEKLTQQQWQKALLRTGVISTRAKWPQGETIIVSMQNTAWLPYTKISLTPKDRRLNLLEGGRTLPEMCGNAAEWDRRKDASQKLGQLPVGKHRIIFEARIERGGWGRHDADVFGSTELWKGEFALDVEVTPKLDDAVPPTHDEAINTAVRDAIGLDVRPWGKENQPQTILVFDADTAKTPAITTTGLSIKATLLRDGVEKQAFPLFIAARDSFLAVNSIYNQRNGLFTFAALKELPAAAIDDPAELKRWTLHLKGTNDHVLDITRATRYWDGTLDIPLADAVKNERERIKGHEPRSYIWMP